MFKKAFILTEYHHHGEKYYIKYKPFISLLPKNGIPNTPRRSSAKGHVPQGKHVPVYEAGTCTSPSRAKPIKE